MKHPCNIALKGARTLLSASLILLLSCSPLLLVFSQTEAVIKTKSTDALTESIVVPTGKSITIDSGGTLTVASGATLSDLNTRAANLIYAGPATGADATPTFRALVAADIPSLSGVYQPLNARLTGIGNLTPGAAEKAVLLEADGTMSTKAYSYGGNGSADQGLIPEYSAGGTLYAGGNEAVYGFLGYTTSAQAVSGQVQNGAGSTGVGVIGTSQDADGEGFGVVAGHTFASGVGFFSGSGGTTGAGLKVLGDGTTILGGGTAASEFRILEPSGSGSNYFGFKAQAMSADAVFTLPAADGTSGQFMKTNGSKVLSFGDVSGLGTGVGTALGNATGGSGGLVTYSGAIGAATATTASVSDNDTSVATTAFVQGERAIVTKSTAASYTIGTTDSRELYGGVIYVTGAATLTIPAVASGASFTVITVGAVAVSVDPNASDLIYLNGTALADGDKITNASTTGDMAVFTYYDGTGWFATTNSGWTDGN